MSFSKSNGHYRSGDNGYNHYKKKGPFGNLFNAVFSGSNHGGNNDPYNQPYPNQQVFPNQQMYPNKQMYPNQQVYSNQQLNSNQQYYSGQMLNQPINNQKATQQDQLICKKCNSRIPTGSKFCLECGEKVTTEIFCLSCGEKLPPNAKFCSNCGSKI